MTDFLGITKRKWLAFGILSAIFGFLNAILSNYIAESILHRQANLVGGFIIAFIAALVLLVLADVLLGKFKEIFRIQIPKRYLAALLLSAASFFPFPSDPNSIPWLITAVGLPMFLISVAFAFVAVFIISLALYLLSNFLAGSVLPAAPVKSKSNKKKSKN